MIGIIDYGMGNLHSVASACAHLGLEAIVSDEIETLARCKKLILPGVGAFGDMEAALHQKGIDVWLKKQVLEEKKPLLGICLGMQALFETSYEFGEYPGLGFLQGSVQAMEPLEYTEDGKTGTLPIPQIGWNRLYVSSDHPLFSVIQEDPYVYFDHTYLACGWNPAQLIAYAGYGPYTVPAIVGWDNILGCQFHPEKSGSTGLAILSWFGKEFGA